MPLTDLTLSYICACPKPKPVFPMPYMGAVMVVIVCWLDLQLPVQSVPITTKVVS
jgi:hypothetical protein